MKNLWLHQSLVAYLILSMIYAPFIQAAQLALPSSDMIAPTLIHDKFTGSMMGGQDYTFEATVTDNELVGSVSLFYREMNSAIYKHIPMERLKGTYVYTLTLDKSQLVAPGIEYYIQAVDASGNRLTSGFASAPNIISITPQEIDINETDKLNLEASSSNKWLWIGLGVLALALAAGGGGGGGGGAAAAPTGTAVDVSTPLP